MIYFFRMISLLIIIYIGYLYSSGFDAGMLPIWLIGLVLTLLMSVRSISQWVFELLKKKAYIRRFLMVAIMIPVILLTWLLIEGNDKSPLKEDYPYVMILGAGLHGDQLSLTLKYRLDVAVDYLMVHPGAYVLVSGGQGEGESLTEAAAMAKYLQQEGVDPSRILKEEASTTTYENMLFSKDILEVQGLSQDKGLLITSDFHVLRGKLIARKLGLAFDGVGTRTLLYLVPNYYFREILAFIKNLPYIM